MTSCKSTLKTLVLIPLFLALFGKVCQAAEGREIETQLMKDLLQGSDVDGRPIKNASHAVTVTFTMSYNQLQDLDEPTQVARSLVWINIFWHDPYMTWNASDYGGYEDIRLDSSRMWTPDLTLYNNANKDGGEMHNSAYKIMIQSDGNVTWSCPVILESVCRIDIEQFPFDTQKCKLKIGSWAYNGLQLDLQLLQSTNGISLSNLEENSVWELKSAHAKRNSVKYTCCVAPYTDLTYTLEFRRKPLYYIMTIIVPSILLSLLASISFLFPADSGERVSLVISVLLGLVVFMLIVNERTPVTSDATPMITHFFNSIGATTILALMATAFILRLNHVSASEPVPAYLAKVRNFIAGALRMKRESPKNRVDINFEEVLLTNAPVQWFNIRELVGLNPFRKQLTDEKILKELQKITAHLEEEKTTSEMKEDWHYTMTVFDRFFFVVFLIIFLAFVAHVFSYF